MRYEKKGQKKREKGVRVNLEALPSVNEAINSRIGIYSDTYHVYIFAT